ncbi:MAG: hypothetical protein MI892_08715 [Desulfobacterales bacterium]|nr:hypothetical protein [Desulfobacterales bacterium]
MADDSFTSQSITIPKEPKHSSKESLLSKIPQKLKVLVGLIAAAIVVTMAIIMFGGMFWFQTEAGYSYHYQNTLTKVENVYTTPGVHFKLPGFSTITRYKQVFTVDYSSDVAAMLDGKRERLSKIATSINKPINVLFADTYTADIPGAFRFKLPIDHNKFLNIHHDFRSFENLVRSLAEKTAKDVVVNTATQYTGEEFLLGAINQFKAAVKDQLSNGIYKTIRRQVEVDETSLATVGVDQEDSYKLKKTKKLVWKTIPMQDRSGNFIRLENPLAPYGIEATQFTMGRPIPEKQLQDLLTDKKKLVAARIKTVQEQETAKEQAKTEQLKADIDRTKAKQQAIKTKELAVIAMQQKVEEAERQAEKEKVEYRKQKDLAVIQKQKELEIAQANRDIQKANFEAAQYEAKAIKEKGLAEAAVIKATYEAYDPVLYSAELEKDVAIQLYRNLGDFEVKMPQIMNLGNSQSPSDGLTSNLKVLADFAAMGLLKDLRNDPSQLEKKRVTAFQ